MSTQAAPQNVDTWNGTTEFQGCHHCTSLQEERWLCELQLTSWNIATICRRQNPSSLGTRQNLSRK